MLKNSKDFYFYHLKKLVRPETFGPYYVHNSSHRLPSYTMPRIIEGRDTIWIKEEQTFAHTEYLRSKHAQFLTISKPYYYCFN